MFLNIFGFLLGFFYKRLPLHNFIFGIYFNKMEVIITKQKGNIGLRLIKQGKMGLTRAIFSKFGIVLLLLLLQGALLLGALVWFEEYIATFFFGGALLSVFMALYILNTRIDPSAKLTWLFVVLVLPVFGSCFFIFTKFEIGHRKFGEKVEKIIEGTKDILPQDEAALNEFKEKDPAAAGILPYLNKTNCFPVYKNTKVTYFPVGEAMFEDLLSELKKAEHFIFLEYFIIDEGIMWGKILEVLAEKAAAGVEVRVMYDGANEFTVLPRDYPKRMAKLGIKCKAFAPLRPIVSTHYNYRDHRKITVIDGKIAFTGGINFADRYININSPFGHWKDTAIKLSGEGAKTFTLMFLQNWNIGEKAPEFEKWLSFPVKPEEEKGYVIPYGDCPMDGEKAGEAVYMHILNRATNYVHIMTPYMILDGELETAIKFAAQRGVEICLILPGIPDKLSPYALAKSHYAALIDAGVKIYEYTPGFIHAKSFVADGKEAAVGTINLDYRSLYHHFECAAYMYEASGVTDVEKDFQETLKKCRLVTKENIWGKYKYLKPVAFIAKLVAPLL